MLLKITAILIILAGIALTLFPRYPGTLLVLAGAVFYGLFAGFGGFSGELVAALLSLAAVAEIGGRWLRVLLTAKFPFTAAFCSASTAGNIGGIIAADAVIGPVAGLAAWEALAGKTLSPHWSTVSRVLIRLAAVAALRFLCALVMFVLIMIYIIS